MPITSIKRDANNNVSIVRIISTDPLSTIASVNYIKNQTPAINALNGGIWQWFLTDVILCAASDSNGFLQFTDDTFSTLVLIASDTHGTITPGLANQVVFYPSNGTTVGGTFALPSQVQVGVNSLNAGTGAGPTTFWRGDGTWATISADLNYSHQAVYVSPDSSDTTGTGTISNPYKTIAHAMTTITTASPTSNFNIILTGGIYNETAQILLKPWVNIFSYTQGSTINNSSAIILHPSWNVSFGAAYYSNLSIANDVTIDFTSLTSAVNPTISFTQISFGGNWTINGATSIPNIFAYDCYLDNPFTFDNAYITSIGNNYQGGVVSGTNTVVGTLSYTAIGDIYPAATFSGANSGGFNASYSISASSIQSLELSGNNTSLFIDAVSYITPDIISGSPSITLTSISNGLSANYTPIHYTPVATPPTLTTSVQAHLHGIDNALAVIGSSDNIVYVSVNGNDTTGNGSIGLPYATISKAMSTITTATATNQFTIYVIEGLINDASGFAIKPFVNISGSSQGAEVTGTTITLDSSWGTTANCSTYIHNIVLALNMTLDLSSYSNTTTSFVVMSNVQTKNITLNTNANTSFTLYIDSCTAEQITSDNTNISCNTTEFQNAISCGANASNRAVNQVYIASKMLSNVTFSSQNGGNPNSYVVGSTLIAGTLTVSNNAATLNIDTVSYKSPTISGGAVLNLTSISNGLTANYTPVNYTPVATPPTLTTSVQAHLHGIDNALVGSGSTPSNAVYVSLAGNDTTGNGTITNPYQTLAHALTTITTASPINIFNVVLVGGMYAEVNQINIKPWVNIMSFSEGTVVSNHLTIRPDTSWNGVGDAFCYLSNFTIEQGINLDFSPISLVSACSVQFNNMNITGTLQMTGAISGSTSYLMSFYLNNCYLQAQPLLDTSGLFSFSNYYADGIACGTVTNVQDNYAQFIGDSFQSAIFLYGGNAAPSANYNIYSCFTAVTGIQMSGNSATLNIDTDSYVVPVINAGTPTINLTSISNGLKANYTPVNYTPDATGTTAPLNSVAAHLHGIDNALASVLGSNSNSVYVSILGNNSTGDGSIEKPYLTIAHAMTTITTASSTINFNIILLDGEYNETVQILLKPYVNIFSYTQNTTINNSSDFIIDSSWNGTSGGISYLSNLSFTGNITLDFSSSTAGNPIIFISNNYTGGSFTINGNPSSTFYIYDSYFAGSNTVNNNILYSFSNFYEGTIILGASSTVTSNQMFSFGDYYVASPTFSSSTQICIYNISAASFTLAPSVSNNNTAIYFDAVSYVIPTVSGSPAVHLTSISNGLLTNFTPTTVVPVDTSVNGFLRGVDSYLTNVTGIYSTTNPVVFSNTGWTSIALGYCTITRVGSIITINALFTGTPSAANQVLRVIVPSTGVFPTNARATGTGTMYLQSGANATNSGVLNAINSVAGQFQVEIDSACLVAGIGLAFNMQVIFSYQVQ